MVSSFRKTVNYLLITSILSGIICPVLQAMEDDHASLELTPLPGQLRAETFPPVVPLGQGVGPSSTIPSALRDTVNCAISIPLSGAIVISHLTRARDHTTSGGVIRVLPAHESGLDFPPPVLISSSSSAGLSEEMVFTPNPLGRSELSDESNLPASPSRIVILTHASTSLESLQTQGEQERRLEARSSSRVFPVLTTDSADSLGAAATELARGGSHTRPLTRRGALTQTLTADDIQLLTDYGNALSRKIYCPSLVSDSALANMMGVPTNRDICCSWRGLLGIPLRIVLVYEAYDSADTAVGLFNYTFFKQIIGKENYYPYQAIQNRALVDLAEMGPLYLLMIATLLPSYGAQYKEIYERAINFLKETKNCTQKDQLHNPKNSGLIKTSTITSAIGAAIVALPKLYSLLQRFQETGVYGGVFQYASLSFYYLNNFYTTYDSAKTYTDSKIHQYLHRDDPETALFRKVLLDLSQHSITKWLNLSAQEKNEQYAQLFSDQVDGMETGELYRKLFFLLDFGRTNTATPISPRKEPIIRQSLRWISEFIAVSAAPVTLGVIRGTMKEKLTSLGLDEKTSDGLAYTAGSIGGLFASLLSRTVIKSSLHQVYDSLTGYKHEDDMASSEYNNSSSGYTSHSKFRTVLTAYNQANGNLMGLTMGKSAYDALSFFPVEVRYTAAAIAMVASGSLNTLFLQRWTHKCVNSFDKSVLQKVERLKSLADPLGVMSDEVYEFARDTRLWITKMPAPVIQQLYKLALNPDLRQILTDRLQPPAVV